jgi:hypothetical protein
MLRTRRKTELVGLGLRMSAWSAQADCNSDGLTPEMEGAPVADATQPGLARELTQRTRMEDCSLGEIRPARY